MTAPDPPTEEEPLIPLSPAVREVVALILVVLAAAHVAWPNSGIDLFFFGLIGLAVVLLFLDIESVEWLGVRARRRQIERTVAAVKDAEVPAGSAVPQALPIPDATDVARRRAPITEGADLQYSAMIVRPSGELLLPPHDPAERLLWAYERIRIELVVLAGNSGGLPRRADWSSYLPAELIAPVLSKLPPELEIGIHEVIRSRNEAIHGKSARALINPAADLALAVLTKLRSIKRSYVRIRRPNVALYADKEIRQLRPEKGVVLAQVDTEGTLLNVEAVPRLLDYAKGRFVSWEWDRNHIVDGETWYQDPVTSETLPAFSKAMAFAGREYPEEWRLDLRLPHPDAGLV